MHFDSDTRMAFRVSREQFLGKINARIAEIDAAMTDKVRMAKVATEYQKQLVEATKGMDVAAKKLQNHVKKIKTNLKTFGKVKQPTYDQLQNFAGYCHSANVYMPVGNARNDYLATYCHWARQMQGELSTLKQLKATLEMSVDER